MVQWSSEDWISEQTQQKQEQHEEKYKKNLQKMQGQWLASFTTDEWGEEVEYNNNRLIW